MSKQDKLTSLFKVLDFIQLTLTLLRSQGIDVDKFFGKSNPRASTVQPRLDLISQDFLGGRFDLDNIEFRNASIPVPLIKEIDKVKRKKKIA